MDHSGPPQIDEQILHDRLASNAEFVGEIELAGEIEIADRDARRIGEPCRRAGSPMRLRILGDDTSK
jgi:hypothetical protein